MERNTPLRAFIYCRVSGHYDAREASLKTQEEACRAFAIERGIEVVGVYHERHTSFDLWERPKLNELRDRIRAGEGNSILVYVVDRLARDQAHTFVIYDELKRAGGKILCATEEFEDTPIGRLLLSIRSYQAEAEKALIKDRTMRGRQAKIDAGRMTGAHSRKYGYRFIIENGRHTGRREIEPREGEIVHRIFERAAEGASAIAIARELDLLGIPTRGKAIGRSNASSHWDPSAIYAIIHDPAYRGETVLSWTKDEGRRRVRRDTPIVLSDVGPAIVSEELFRRANERLGEKNNRHRAIREEGKIAPLRGLLSCGECGRPASLTYTRKKNAAGEPVFRYFYRCSSRADRKRIGKEPCPNSYVGERRITDLVWRLVVAFLDNPEEMVRRANTASAIDTRIEDLKRSRVDLEGRLLEIDRQRERLIERVAVCDPGDVELYEDRLSRLRRDREPLVRGIAEIDARLESIRPVEIDLVMVQKLRKGLSRASEFSDSAKARIISSVVGRAFYFLDGSAAIRVGGMVYSSGDLSIDSSVLTPVGEACVNTEWGGGG